MRPFTYIILLALSTVTPALFAQFTMGGLGTSMGIMGGLQGMGSQAGGIGMGAVNGLQGTMGMTGGMMGGMTPGLGGMSGMGGMGMGGMSGMGGMGRPGMMFSYARTNLRPQAGMTHVRVGANGPVNPRPQPTLADWRRALRLHQPLSLKW